MITERDEKTVNNIKKHLNQLAMDDKAGIDCENERWIETLCKQNNERRGMKVIAHIQVVKDYGIAVMASVNPQELVALSEEYNCEQYRRSDGTSPYLEHDRECTVVTVEVEVPDSVFKREPRAVLRGVFVGAYKGNSTDTRGEAKSLCEGN